MPVAHLPQSNSEDANSEDASHEESSICKRPTTIPCPKTVSLEEFYGSWEGFRHAMHRSIGKDLGSSKISFSVNFTKVVN